MKKKLRIIIGNKSLEFVSIFFGVWLLYKMPFCDVAINYNFIVYCYYLNLCVIFIIDDGWDSLKIIIEAN